MKAFYVAAVFELVDVALELAAVAAFAAAAALALAVGAVAGAAVLGPNRIRHVASSENRAAEWNCQGR